MYVTALARGSEVNWCEPRGGVLKAGSSVFYFFAIVSPGFGIAVRRMIGEVE
jgi:hypothetical protein